MSTFFRFLGDLTVLDWLFICAAWVIVAFALGTFTGLGIKLSGRSQHYTDLTLEQPPVPTQAEIDAVWLAPWPAGDDDEIALRFSQILAAEGLQ